MGAAACSLDGKLLAVTEAYPSEFSCKSVLGRMHRDSLAASRRVDRRLRASHGPRPPERSDARGGWRPSGRRPSGPRPQLPRTTGGDGSKRPPPGLFSILSVGASVITLLAARLAWRGWTLELRRALSGQATPEFQPLVRDVRSLVDRLALERRNEARSGPWDADRLRAALKQHLQGERVVVLANREPYIHDKARRERSGCCIPASGLVTALEPVMRACSGVWVAHGSGTADKEMSDAEGRVRVPPGEESYLLRRVWLTEEEERGYYYGFSNEGLWPLCHVADARPVFRSEDWDALRDGQPALRRRGVRGGRLGRSHRPRAGLSLRPRAPHDPAAASPRDDPDLLAHPVAERRAPRHLPLARGDPRRACSARASSGFHTQQHCNNFMDSVDAFLESRIDRENNSVVQGPRRTLVRAYPISIEWPVRRLEGLPPASECRSAVRKELGIADDALLGVGVDRLDYTKGIEERLHAVDALLERHAELRGRFVFAQLAAPSRTKIERYRELNDRVEALATAINERWGQGDYRPIILMRSHHEPATVFRYFRAADLCYVSSLHDGMNLVAKEFVAARDDERGVLVLSQFTGAARDLPEALIVNPYDLAQASDALATALKMPAAEQQERMRSMRRMVSEFNVYRWAGRMLIDAAEVRRRDRMTGRLAAASPDQRRDGMTFILAREQPSDSRRAS